MFADIMVGPVVLFVCLFESTEICHTEHLQMHELELEKVHQKTCLDVYCKYYLFLNSSYQILPFPL